MLKHNAHSHQKKEAFGAAVEKRSTARRDYDFVTPMHLLDMLWKLKPEHHDLDRSEKAVLGVLITHVNFKILARDRHYEAWPTIEKIMKQVHLRDRTVEGCRRSLEQREWVKVHAGGPGKANHYYINGRKIVDAYNLSFPKERVKFQRDSFATIKSVPSSARRNLSNLKQGPQFRERLKTQGEVERQPAQAGGLQHYPQNLPE